MKKDIHPAYGPVVFRDAAGFAFLAAAGWFCNRTFGTNDRLEEPTVWMTQHLVPIAVAIAAMAIVSRLTLARRSPAASPALSD